MSNLRSDCRRLIADPNVDMAMIKAHLSRACYQIDDAEENWHNAAIDAKAFRDAITKHRDQKGDDRCWLDDQELYIAAGLEPAETALPCRNDFLASCERYWCQRQTPEQRTRPPGKTIGQLERETKVLVEIGREVLAVYDEAMNTGKSTTLPGETIDRLRTAINGKQS